jgi:DNA-binding NtrC family response regulator
MGLFEAAEGGTLFLDEIPSLSPAVQVKLLKAIEDRVIRRVGGNRAVPIDVRLLAATNVDLRDAVAGGRFREDLLQRLDLFRVRIPPLRERGPELAALAQVLVDRLCRRYGLEKRAIPPEGVARLAHHRWPGNVRELAHELERSLVFDDDRLTLSGLARTPVAGAGAGTASGTADWFNPAYRFPAEGFLLEQAIDRLVQTAVEQSNGNVSEAARRLGVSRDVVRYRLKPENR